MVIAILIATAIASIIILLIEHYRKKQRERSTLLLSLGLSVLVLTALVGVLGIKEERANAAESDKSTQELQGKLAEQGVDLLAARSTVEALENKIANDEQAKAARLQRIFDKWKAGAGVSGKERRLTEASGRYITPHKEIKVSQNNEGEIRVSVTYWGSCKSNNFLIGSKGTFRLRVAGQEMGEVRCGCGPRGGKASSPKKTLLLTSDQVTLLGPKDITLSADYR